MHAGTSTCGDDPLERLLPLPAMIPGSATEIIAVNGWIASREDYVAPFAALDQRHGVPTDTRRYLLTTPPHHFCHR